MPAAITQADDARHVPGGLHQVAPLPPAESVVAMQAQAVAAPMPDTAAAPDWDAMQQEWNSTGRLVRSSVSGTGQR